MQEQIHLKADYSELQKIIDWVRPKVANEIQDLQTTLRLVIITEEFFTNIAKYAYPGTNGDADITFLSDEKAVYIIITDSGIPFDPTTAPEADIHKPIDERGLGGLGIFISKFLVDKLSYKREDGKNILTIIKYK